MADIFKEVLPSILQHKENVFVSPEDYETYVPYLVNMAMSYQTECVFYAVEMDMRPNLSKKSQYLFYLNSIRPTKRSFVKWAKKEEKTSTERESVKRYYGLTDAKAEEALMILTTEEIKKITRLADLGGVVK